MLLMLLLLFATDAVVNVEDDATVNASFDKNFASIGFAGEYLDVDADGSYTSFVNCVAFLLSMLLFRCC